MQYLIFIFRITFRIKRYSFQKCGVGKFFMFLKVLSLISLTVVILNIFVETFFPQYYCFHCILFSNKCIQNFDFDMIFDLFTEQRDRGTDQNLWWIDCQDGEELAVRSTEFLSKPQRDTRTMTGQRRKDRGARLKGPVLFFLFLTDRTMNQQNKRISHYWLLHINWNPNNWEDTLGSGCNYFLFILMY